MYTVYIFYMSKRKTDSLVECGKSIGEYVRLHDRGWMWAMVTVIFSVLKGGGDFFLGGGGG
jgi:hypothetical protein